MGQGKALLEVGNRGGIEKESEYCSKCSVLDERYSKAEERCTFLELEIEKKKMNDIEEVQRRMVELKTQNDLLKSLPKIIKGFDEKSSQTMNGDNDTIAEVDLMEDVENDKVLELMIENKVLNCEKKKAESDVAFWKAKCKELELQVALFSERCKKPVIKTEMVKEQCCDVATPPIHSFYGNSRYVNGASEEILHEKRVGYSSRTRKQLNFGEETCDKMRDATPTGGLPGVIDISDSSDDDEHAPQKSTNMTRGLDDLGGGIDSSYKRKLSSRNRMMKVKGEIESEDDHMTGTPSLLASNKRKRAHHIVYSDDGSDTDDNIPLHRLRKRYSSLQDSCRKRAGGSTNRDINESKHNCGIVSGDETEDNESDSEGESLNGFIVSGSSVDDDDECCEGGNESEDKSEGKVDYDEIMNIIGRKKKDHLIKWEFEADMLAAFGKDDELCMKAVCALYRQQTSDEKSCKATIHQNQRGFSQCDATRGSILGEFLTDGDPEGGLKKSVDDLLEFEAKGVELCIKLATRYSKQLFAMYENEEDPLWPCVKDTDSS